MADISFLMNEDMEDTDEPMEDTDDGKNGGDGAADDRGDEGGGESLPPMTRLYQHAACKTSYNRQLVGRILVEVFRSAVETGSKLNVEEVMHPVRRLVKDNDPAVRIDLVEQLPHVAMICQEAPDRLGDVLPRHLLRIIRTFFYDVDQQVRQATHAAFLALIDRGLLDKKSAEHLIAPTVLRMTQQPERIELFALAIDGMSKIARILDEATAERLFLDRFLALCGDDNFFIRRLCSFRFGEFSASMSKETVYEKLLPTYVNLCKDYVWSVRKTCSDVMVSFACCVSLHHRRTTLAGLLANFLTDDSKWVRVSACQILGPFISTFATQFTGFSYSQYGELVLIDQHGTELRYNVLSAASSTEPPLCKAVMTSGQIVHFYDDIGSSIPKTDTGAERPYTNKENIPLNDRTNNSQWNTGGSLSEENQDNDATIAHDYDEFNPFRYYYIAPDLPLDTELVQAAMNESTEKLKKSRSQEEEASAMPTVASTSRSSEGNERTYVPVETNEENDDRSNCRAEQGSDNSEALGDHEEASEEDAVTKRSYHSKTTHGHLILKRMYSKTKAEGGTRESAELNDTLEANSSSSDLGTSVTGGANAAKIDHSADSGQTIVPHVLINFFISMADSSAKSIGIEIPRYCAYSFPAVALTLGRENWPLLKNAYEALANAREYRVRRTLASSIHELAMILGEDLAARDLLPIYDGFVKDLDEVRIGALKHLKAFFTVLRPADRQSFLPRLKAFLTMDNEWNWRFREEVAARLLEAVPLFGPEDVSDHIAPLSFPLLIDKVAAVRHTALALATRIISYLSTDEHLVTTLVQDLKYLLATELSKWPCRQTFALLCSSLISNEAISPERFGRDLLPCLLNLSSDVVPNVRLAVVTALSRHVVQISDHLDVELMEKVNQKLIQMRTDPDRDVRIIAGGVAGKYHPQGAEWKVPVVKSNYPW